MNAKARALGMGGSNFQNPHGLPNSNQYTTARDMAKLAIALKRDFPQYYQYFSTRQFSWKGVTYYTHNRVMLRYSGTDGLKTGFINASGFNVATSTVRGGRPLVGVVMGGASGKWRDDRMIQLLDSGFATLAKRGQSRGRLYAENLPLLNGKPMLAERQPARPPEVVTKLQVAQVKADRGVVKAETARPRPVELVEPQAKAPIVTAPPKPTEPGPMVIRSIPANPAPNTLDAQFAALQRRQGQAETSAAVGLNEMWGIQVGAFSSPALAERAALQAYQLAQDNLHGSRISVVGMGASGAMVHRARLENISEQQAKKACETLISNNSPCFIYRSGS